MLLRIENSTLQMKLVFQLREELRTDPERIVRTQALTLNPSRPKMGLKGSHGLFGSNEWWQSIEDGSMPLLYLSGVVREIYQAGQDGLGKNNTIDIVLENGSVETVGIYVNNESDTDLFCVDRRVEVVYALDELKLQPANDGGINTSRIALEMAIQIR